MKAVQHVPNSRLSAAFGDRRFYERGKVLLSRPKRALAGTAVKGLVENAYGESYDLELLGSEAESTYRATRKDGEVAILKISSEPDGEESFSIQVAALSAVADADGLVVPHVLPTSAGEALFHDAPTGLLGYMQTALDGPLLRDLPMDACHRVALGQAAGGLSRALATLEHYAAARPVLWNARSWTHLREFADDVSDLEHRRLALQALDAVDARIAPRVHALPWQITHNDLSPSNTLILDDGFGVIDFGDAGLCLRLVDAATVAMYTTEEGSSSRLRGAEPAIASFEASAPLTPEEHDLLVPMIRGRAAALVLINAWRAKLFPAEADYINKNGRSAVRALRAFDTD